MIRVLKTNNRSTDTSRSGGSTSQSLDRHCQLKQFQSMANQSAVTQRLLKYKPVVQAKFADDTTFGLEIEFKNRWVSEQDLGKSVVGMRLDGALADWKAESDRGRLFEGRAGTVLELESRPYSAGEIKDPLPEHINKAYSDSVKIAVKLGESLSSAPPVGEVTSANKTDEVDTSASEKISEDHEKAPSATLQITTLGRRTKAHIKALSDTSDAFEEENMNMFGHNERAHILDGARNKALEAIAEWDTLRANGDRGADPVDPVFEDFTSILSPLIQLLYMSRNGINEGFGTIKNLLVPVLPRRVIKPPAVGFASALGVDKTIYRSKVGALRPGEDAPVKADQLWSLLYAEVDKTDENEPLRDHSDLYLKDLREAAAKRDQENSDWNKDHEDDRKTVTGGVDLLHTIAGSEPTMEGKIIELAGKALDKDWTSHEIRNAAFAMGMSVEQMQRFISILAKQT